MSGPRLPLPCAGHCLRSNVQLEMQEWTQDDISGDLYKEHNEHLRFTYRKSLRHNNICVFSFIYYNLPLYA